VSNMLAVHLRDAGADLADSFVIKLLEFLAQKAASI
jgi:hypothetical protein